MKNFKILPNLVTLCLANILKKVQAWNINYYPLYFIILDSVTKEGDNILW